MQTEQMVYTGTDEQQRLARDAFLALRTLGASYGMSAPIRQPLSALVAFFGKQPALAASDDPAAVLDAALTANKAVFAREVSDDGVVSFVTTRSGRPPDQSTPDTSFTLKTRLTQPAPIVEVAPPAPVAPIEPPTRVAEVWLRAPAGSPAPASPEVTAPPEDTSEPEPAAEIEAVAEPTVPPPTEVEDPAPLAVPSADLDVATVAAALRERLPLDLRLVSFGDEWFVDDALMRLSRGDTKRIRDYLVERGEPLSDDELLADVFGRRVTDRDYALTRFALNQRMSREKRDFEFVGTPHLRLWSTSGLPTIGTPKRKPAELGQDYRFLLEPAAAEADVTVGDQIQHALSYYEYEYGVLPLNSRFAAFFPGPMLEEQRAAVLRLDVPQMYTTYLVELRYPTANRGGFISGLEQFYAENLVPGAQITIDRANSDGRYVLRFGQSGAQERRLLELDERRGRFVFRPVTFFCEVDEDMLLSDTKYAGLNNAKVLEERDRRRPEVVARTTFERIGEQVGEKKAPRYYALFDDLFAAASIERPFTRPYLLSVLTSEQHPEFERDPDGAAFTYDPARVQ
jgi:hypothetical protein